MGESMPGGRSRTFRLGDRSELLVQHLLTGIAFTTPVPRQEDVGIDFFCTLMTGYDDPSLLKAGTFFSAQAKSSQEPLVYEKPHELEWITNQENPLLLCIADREESAMDVYSTWNLLCAVLNGWHGQKRASSIRLVPGKGCSEWPGVVDNPDGSQDVLLGKPIIQIAHHQIFDEVSTKEILAVIEKWIALDRENIVNRRAGLNWVAGPIAYETGKPPAPGLAVSFYWNPNNLAQCALNLGRSATALWRVLHHGGMPKEALTQDGFGPAIPSLRELLRWLRTVDPSLNNLLQDIDQK